MKTKCLYHRDYIRPIRREDRSVLKGDTIRHFGAALLFIASVPLVLAGDDQSKSEPPDELIEKEQKKATQAREKKLAETKAETAQKIDSGRSDIENQATAARAEIEANAEKMADHITATILKS